VSCASGFTGTPGPITCQSDGLWTLTSGCSPTSSGSCPTSPVQDGYVIASGSSSAGSTRTVSCAAGFTGAATSITCQSNFQWTLSSGCSGSSSGSCPSSPVFEGYVVASGSSTAGSTRTVSCASGFSALQRRLHAKATSNGPFLLGAMNRLFVLFLCLMAIYFQPLPLIS